MWTEQGGTMGGNAFNLSKVIAYGISIIENDGTVASSILRAMIVGFLL